MPGWMKNKGQELVGLALEIETAFLSKFDDVPVEIVQEEDSNKYAKEDVPRS